MKLKPGQLIRVLRPDRLGIDGKPWCIREGDVAVVTHETDDDGDTRVKAFSGGDFFYVWGFGDFFELVETDDV